MIVSTINKLIGNTTKI